MKPALRISIAFFLLMTLLAGCNWMRLLEFRNQLKHLSEYAHWEERESGHMLVFSEPILELSDLRNFGFSPTPVRQRLLGIKYRYRIDGTDVAGSSEMLFQMKDEKLCAVAFPAIIIEIIGQKGVEGFLRIAGGDRSLDSDKDVGVVNKARALHAVFGASVPPVDDRKICIIFSPQDHLNRELKIEFEESKRPGLYSKMSLSIGPERKPASDAGSVR